MDPWTTVAETEAVFHVGECVCVCAGVSKLQATEYSDALRRLMSDCRFVCHNCCYNAPLATLIFTLLFCLPPAV